MTVILFQSRFRDLVKSGEKRHTIRPRRKRRLKAGQVVDLRNWTGKAYRSKQADIKTVTLKSVEDIEITLVNDLMQIAVEGILLQEKEFLRLIRADGFTTISDFRTFFEHFNKFPFEGDLIKW